MKSKYLSKSDTLQIKETIWGEKKMNYNYGKKLQVDIKCLNTCPGCIVDKCCGASLKYDKIVEIITLKIQSITRNILIPRNIKES